MIKVKKKTSEIFVSKLPLLITDGSGIVLLTSYDVSNKELLYKGITLVTNDKRILLGGLRHFNNLSGYYLYEGTLEISNR